MTVVELAKLEVVATLEPGARYHEVVISPDSRHALLLSEGPGWAEAMRTRQFPCMTACMQLTIVDLERRQISSSTPLELGWATLIGP
jgi:hypothetical protein